MEHFKQARGKPATPEPLPTEPQPPFHDPLQGEMTFSDEKRKEKKDKRREVKSNSP